MNLSFKRITSQNNFIPEIDGLRFLAIMSVLFFHLNLYLNEKDNHIYIDNINYSIFKNIVSKGHLGVSLFFVLSGFILSFPFAKYYLKNEKKVYLREYFLRRLTRLEPPYIVVMSILFFACVFVVKNITLSKGILSFVASILYIHNFIFPGEFPFLNVVAWSLEIEVQFYIIAPFLCYLFSINNIKLRRGLIIFLILIFIILNVFFKLNNPNSLINYLHYFLLGFLIVDFYISESVLIKKSKFNSYFCLFFFILIWGFQIDKVKSSFLNLLFELVKITSILIFYYYVIILKAIKLLSNNKITNLGGMCYSIYLLHYPIISLFGRYILKFQISNYSFFNVFFYSNSLIIITLFISAIFYLLIEKPCMNKNWYKIYFKTSAI